MIKEGSKICFWVSCYWKSERKTHSVSHSLPSLPHTQTYTYFTSILFFGCPSDGNWHVFSPLVNPISYPYPLYEFVMHLSSEYGTRGHTGLVTLSLMVCLFWLIIIYGLFDSIGTEECTWYGHVGIVCKQSLERNVKMSPSPPLIIGHSHMGNVCLWLSRCWITHLFCHFSGKGLNCTMSDSVLFPFYKRFNWLSMKSFL